MPKEQTDMVGDTGLVSPHAAIESKSRSLEIVLLIVALALPVAMYLAYPRIIPSGSAPDVIRRVAVFEASPINFQRQQIIGEPPFGQQITHIEVLPNDSGGRPDVVYSDALAGQVIRLSQSADGQWSPNVINTDRLLPCPAGITPVDLDQDGDQDFVVSCLGGVQPTNDLVGRVVWLRNDNGVFSTHDLLRYVRRVTDTQFGDFDQDGDLDLVVAVFGGLLQGQILYLENDGQQNFTDYEIMNASGTIHVPVADFDGDGDLDVAAVVTQEEEEVWVFENEGQGLRDPKRHLVSMSWNFDLGGAGMVATDLDLDGDQDLLVALGDNLELINNAPQPWHGVKWLENLGGMKFAEKQIADVGGIYGITPGDVDGDGDLDVIAVSMFNDWAQDGAASVVWLENDGQQNFKTWQIASEPIQLATVTGGDLDADGDFDFLTGSFHFRKPFQKLGSVDLFINEKGGNQ